MDVLKAHQTKGFVSVRYPPKLKHAVVTAYSSWAAFCRLPVEQKLVFSNGDRIKDFGYMLRRDKGETADFKEQFHVSRKELLELRRRSAGMPLDAVYFIEACNELIAESSELIHDYALAIERQYNLPGFAQNTMKSADNWTFRFLHYFGGEVLANAHADRGGFTLRLFETVGGGEFLSQDGVWKDWEIDDGKTIIFPSMVLQHATNGRAKALWHRVLAPSGATDRYAMVAFVNFTHTHRYDDERQRIADLPEGCTYDMPWGEFDKLFKPVA